MNKTCETCVWRPDWSFDEIFNPGHGVKRHGRCNWPGNPKYKGNPFIIVTEEKLDYETVIKDSSGKFIETYSSHLPCPKWEEKDDSQLPKVKTATPMPSVKPPKTSKSPLSYLLWSTYSIERQAWCVYKKESETKMIFLCRCHTQKAAEKLARDVNNGASICKGSRELGTACGECVKCELTT